MFEESLYIALGGALGSLGRFWLTKIFASLIGGDFPWGTVIVNITGCLAIGLFGFLTSPIDRFPAPPLVRQFFMIGICGGYTTFSSFSLQTLTMMEKGAWLEATAHIIGSVVLCLLAVWLGHLIALQLNQVK